MPTLSFTARYCQNFNDLKENDIVCKTLDYNLNKELQILPTKKIPVQIKVIAKVICSCKNFIIHDIYHPLPVYYTILPYPFQEFATRLPLYVHRHLMSKKELPFRIFQRLRKLLCSR